MAAYTITGSEVLQVLPIQANSQPAATTVQVTTQQIASLAATEQVVFANTAITTVGNGTLTAAGIVGTLITRTGPTAVYSDTIDTAANIVAALPGFIANQSWQLNIKNGTAFYQTLVAGTGITFVGNSVIAPYSTGLFEVNVTSATAVTLIHIRTDVTNNALVSNPTLVAATNTTTLSAITGLAVPLLTSGTYSITGAVQVNSTAGAGATLQIGTSASGTLTANSINVTGKFYTATGIAVNNTLSFGTTPGTGVGTSAPVVLAELEGSIVVGAAGILQIYGGQQAANAGSTNFLSNGFLQVERVG